MSLKISLASLVLLSWVSFAMAADDPGTRIWNALLAAPPSVPQSEARVAALEELDAWIGQPDSEESPELVAYYRRAIDRVIEKLESERPKKGVRYFQLYSSSVIIQTPECVFAIDLDQGPNSDLRQTPEEEGTALCMTDEQVARLAGLIDYAFHTHEHSDHIDYEITQALMARDKQVIVTESMKRLWADEPWAEQLVTLRQTISRPRKVGDLEVDVLWDHQWDNEEHVSGTPCYALVISGPHGVSVGTKGDINCGLRLLGWMHTFAATGRTIDLMVGSPIFWRGPDLGRQIDEVIAPIWAPGHNWEFTHRKAGEARGNASGFAQSCKMMGQKAKCGTAVALSWGEYLDVPKRKK